MNLRFIQKQEKTEDEDEDEDEGCRQGHAPGTKSPAAAGRQRRSGLCHPTTYYSTVVRQIDCELL
jgi:hypothetical protein